MGGGPVGGVGVGPAWTRRGEGVTRVQGTAGGAWCARRRAVWLRASLPWFSLSPSPVWPALAAATSPPNYQTNQKSPIL